MNEILDFIVSTIIDLFVIGSFVLPMRELYKKGAVTLAYIGGILYSVSIMILTVSGPRVTFLVASILFVTFTVKLISHKL